MLLLIIVLLIVFWPVTLMVLGAIMAAFGLAVLVVLWVLKWIGIVGGLLLLLAVVIILVNAPEEVEKVSPILRRYRFPLAVVGCLGLGAATVLVVGLFQ